MRTVNKIVITLGLAALLASPALAQRGGGGMGLGQMLTNEGVQKELKLDKDQTEKIKDAIKKVQDDNKDDIAKLRDRDTSREERQEINKKLNVAYEKSVSDILNADQKKRLKQIQIQAEGLQAFSDADIVKALSLTDDQKTKIKEISEDVAKQMQELRSGGGGRGNFEKMAEIRKDSMEKATKLLTDDQKKTWKDLTGDPFQFQFGGRRGGGNQTRTREA
jgi:Spy/CpxP family protein refolding chaperone